MKEPSISNITRASKQHDSRIYKRRKWFVREPSMCENYKSILTINFEMFYYWYYMQNLVYILFFACSTMFIYLNRNDYLVEISINFSFNLKIDWFLVFTHYLVPIRKKFMQRQYLFWLNRLVGRHSDTSCFSLYIKQLQSIKHCACNQNCKQLVIIIICSLENNARKGVFLSLFWINFFLIFPCFRFFFQYIIPLFFKLVIICSLHFSRKLTPSLLGFLIS